jgi:tryptophan 2,3-dioxygenase
MRKQVTYWDYLKLDTLLSLQSGVQEEADNVSVDELHFIVVHQTFELWFKVRIELSTISPRS